MNAATSRGAWGRSVMSLAQAAASFPGLVVQPFGGPDPMTPMLLFPNARTVWLIGKESFGSHTDWQFWGRGEKKKNPPKAKTKANKNKN